MKIKRLITAVNIDYLQRGSRVAIAAVVATLIYKVLQLHYGYWLVFTTVIVIQANTGATIKRAKDRVFGTILGVLVGVSVLIILPNNFIILMLLVTLLVFLTVYLSTTSYNYAMFFGSILFVILLRHTAASPWQFGELRIVDTLIGSLIGLLASYWLWPNCARLELYASLSFALEKTYDHFVAITNAYLHHSFDEKFLLTKKIANEEALQKSKKLLAEFSYEPGYLRFSDEAITAILLSLESLFDILISLTIVARHRQPDLEINAKVTEFIE